MPATQPLILAPYRTWGYFQRLQKLSFVFGSNSRILRFLDQSSVSLFFAFICSSLSFSTLLPLGFLLGLCCGCFFRRFLLSSRCFPCSPSNSLFAYYISQSRYTPLIGIL